MNKYTIKYTYDNYVESCECCSYSEQELTVYDKEGNVLIDGINAGMWPENESELRVYIDETYPEYNDFVVHDDTRWF